MNITFRVEQRNAILQSLPRLASCLAAVTKARQQVCEPEARQPVQQRRQCHQPEPQQAAEPAEEMEAAQQPEREAQQHLRATAAAQETGVAQGIERKGQRRQQAMSPRQLHRPRQDAAVVKQPAARGVQAEVREAQQQQQQQTREQRQAADDDGDGEVPSHPQEKTSFV